MKSKTIAFLWILAGFMPLACVFFGQWVFWHVTDRPTLYMVDPGGTVLQSLLVAGPFAVLALMAPGRLRAEARRVTSALFVAAASGGLVTAGLWATFYYSGYSYWEHPEVSGEAIGMGCVMGVSPLVVGGIMFVAYGLAKRLSV